jgi:hypothetical protein
MNNEMQTCDNIFSLVGSINSKDNTINTTLFDSISRLSNSLISIYNDEKSKLPYHINIVDLLRANENAHSRIFAELLKQNNLNKYNILESLYNYLLSINSNFDKKPIKPRITSEKNRIDLLILDTDYAIIIENKIHGATDQFEQLARYIDRIKNQGIKEKQIWVIYLTRYGNEPENQSWRNYKNTFTERFFKISFRNDILPWLEETVLPNCKIKDVYLKSTIEQYIDHLKGMFRLRTNQNKMNKELQNHIKQVLELTSNPEKDHQVLRTKLNELQKVEGYINDMLLSMEKECWQKWLDQLKTDFPNYETISYPYDKKFPKIGIILEYKGVRFTALIEKESNIYYGFGRHEASEKLNPEIQELLKPLLGEFKETHWWYGWKYTSFENGYNRLKALIEKVIPLITENK